MKTKNFFRGMFILAIAGLWTGCANDEVLEPLATNGKGKGNEISFRVQGGMLRATGTTVNNVNAFVVSAYGDVTTISKPTLDGVTVYRKEGTDNFFDYNPKAYFDNSDGNVYFSAYSPVSKYITKGLAGTADNEITYTVPAPDATGITTQEDLLVAYTNVAAQPTNVAEGKAVVPMNFKHALSRVFVKAKNTLSSGHSVTIKAISLHNLYNEGTLDIDATTWTGSGTFNSDYQVSINDGYKATTPADFGDYKILWMPAGEQKNVYSYVLPTGGVSLPKSSDYLTLTSAEQGMLILPQTTVYPTNVADTTTYDGAKAFYLEITYSVANVTNTIRIPYGDLYGIGQTAANEGLTFEFGRQYALNIEFNNKNVNLIEINFTVTVEQWVDPEVDVPLNP